jgi:hypothetical protein
MFDYVICEVPLPDGWKPDELQSKDFDCSMTNIRISAEGRLLIERYESYTVPKEDRLYPDAKPGSIEEICGILGRRNHRWEDLNFHGDFNFYGGAFKNDWHEYMARFTEGQLVSIRAVHEPAIATEARRAETLGSVHEGAGRKASPK